MARTHRVGRTMEGLGRMARGRARGGTRNKSGIWRRGNVFWSRRRVIWGKDSTLLGRRALAILHDGRELSREERFKRRQEAEGDGKARDKAQEATRPKPKADSKFPLVVLTDVVLLLMLDVLEKIVFWKWIVFGKSRFDVSCLTLN